MLNQGICTVRLLFCMLRMVNLLYCHVAWQYALSCSSIINSVMIYRHDQGYFQIAFYCDCTGLNFPISWPSVLYWPCTTRNKIDIILITCLRLSPPQLLDMELSFAWMTCDHSGHSWPLVSVLLMMYIPLRALLSRRTRPAVNDIIHTRFSWQLVEVILWMLSCPDH